MSKLVKTLKFFSLCLVGVMSSAFFNSCKPEHKECDECNSNKGHLVETVFYLDNGKPDETSTRSVVLNGKEGEITTLKIGLYTNGTLNKTNTYAGTEQNNLTFSLYDNLRYNFYVMVNDDSFVFPQRESELSAKTISVPDYADMNRTGMLMSGVLKDILPDGHTKFAFHVQRLFRRIVVNFATSEDVSDIHIASAKLLNANSVLKPFGKSGMVSPRTLVESTDETFSKGGQLVLYAPEAYSDSPTTQLSLEGTYMFKGNKTDCSKVIDLGTALERNTMVEFSFFELFVPKEDEGGVIVDNWTAPSMYVAQAKTLSFGVSGNSDFDVRISDNAGAKVMDLQKIGTRASGNTNVELKLGGLKAGDYTIEIVKNGKVTDSKQFVVKKPTLKFDSPTYALSNVNSTQKFALSYVDEENHSMSTSDFDSSLYDELLKPTAYKNLNSPIKTKFYVSNDETKIELSQDITSKDEGTYEGALLAKPMNESTGVSVTSANIDILPLRKMNVSLEINMYGDYDDLSSLFGESGGHNEYNIFSKSSGMTSLYGTNELKHYNLSFPIKGNFGNDYYETNGWVCFEKRQISFNKVALQGYWFNDVLQYLKKNNVFISLYTVTDSSNYTFTSSYGNDIDDASSLLLSDLLNEDSIKDYVSVKDNGFVINLKILVRKK